MKHLPALFALAIMSIVLMGCPYNAKVAIDAKPTIKINRELLGVWKTQKDDTISITVTAKSDKEYAIKAVLPNLMTKGYSEYDMTAFASKVGNYTVLNVIDEQDMYSYIVMIYKDGNLSLQPLAEEMTDKEFGTPAETRAFLEKYLAQPEDKIQYADDVDLTKMYKVKR